MPSVCEIGVRPPRLDFGARLRLLDRVRLELILDPAQAIAGAFDALGRQPPPASRVKLVAQERGGLRGREDHSLAWVQFEPAPRQELCDLAAPFRQLLGAVGEQREVINIAQIRRTQFLGAEMIQRIEKDIRELLAGEIADRQAAAPLKRGEQIIAGEMQIYRLLRI